ncbi:MAG: prepilin-type N-terminal cleavage/methylation domain-containing protein [Candidatus Sumerlaeia bacterium]|nr:prepilin-type N-terminal cleavage/methylation domain-containing protein [Candidatus Sumerlaeia bacterium]
MNPTVRRARPRAFTLLELLIVVAIIAILAAIAVPNFLEAQTRAKVSRVKADLRTIVTALESYAVDHNKFPFDGHPGQAHWGWVTSSTRLTTPIAYITSLLRDPFQDDTLQDTGLPGGHTHFLDHPERKNHTYDYGTAHWHGIFAGLSPGYVKNFGASPWKVGSAGPDRRFHEGGSHYGMAEFYDPSNGTVSDGDIYRSIRGQH